MVFNVHYNVQVVSFIYNKVKMNKKNKYKLEHVDKVVVIQWQ